MHVLTTDDLLIKNVTNVSIIPRKEKAAVPGKITDVIKSYMLDDNYILFWDLMRTIDVHGYTRAAISTIGRSSIGAWWQVSKHPEYRQIARVGQRTKLLNFYYMLDKPWDNIKDFYTIAYKIMTAVMYLRYFGQAAFHILRDGFGRPIGLDFMHGYVVPNVDSSGNFKTPAFVQYLTEDGTNVIHYNDPMDVVYIVNPDFEGKVTGGTDMEALTNYNLPLDLYLQTGARNYIKNRNKPEAFFVVSPEMSGEAFDAFTKVLTEWYSGPENLGKNPVAVQGDLKIVELDKLPDAIPYQETRNSTREETLSVSGVSGAKLGLDTNSAAEVKELRREFHETTMVPVFRLVELALYEQVHVREFGYRGWEFKFLSPTFLNDVEQATVDMRYYSIGVNNPNEIRERQGLDPREDGDLFVDQLESANAPSNTPLANPDNEPGSPPEGREEEPDSPSNVGEPTLDDQDPPRGDQHDEEQRIIKELASYRNFVINRMKRNKKVNRQFKSDIFTEYELSMFEKAVDEFGTIDDAKEFFNRLIEIIEER